MSMNWLTPLGFLGLIGILVLILIYIIKPNYQQKMVSSTYIWKLSLKYRKKKLPINRLRNLLILLCQILILSLCATLLAQPFLAEEREVPEAEKIVIIDGSGNMLAKDAEGVTRLQHSVEQVRQLAQEVSDANGRFTVIFAGETASFVVNSASPNDLITTNESLEQLAKDCTTNKYYNAGDVDGAISLANQILAGNPAAEVVLYTSTTYLSDGQITVKNMSDQNTEWNAAILSVTDILEDNKHCFEVELVSYGRNAELYLSYNIKDMISRNGDRYNPSGTIRVQCEADKVETIRLESVPNPNEAEQSVVPEVSISSYQQVQFDILQAKQVEGKETISGVRDSFSEDNTVYLYGGTKPVLKVQYSSSRANPFFEYVMKSLREGLRGRWDIELTIIRGNQAAALTGFDFYIFEHQMPEQLPKDGAVFLADLDRIPAGLDIELIGDSDVSGNFALVNGEEHPVTNLVHPENIEMTAYQRMRVGSGFDTLMYCGGDPVFVLKNTPEQKVAVLSFSLNRSNASMLVEFPTMMYNLFNYFIPSTLEGQIYEMGDVVTIQARTGKITLETPSSSQDAQNNLTGETYTDLPMEFIPDMPGTYTVKQEVGGATAGPLAESFFVKIPGAQSNIFPVEESPTPIYREAQTETHHVDLVVYFAAALVFLLFAEWWLQSRSQI